MERLPTGAVPWNRKSERIVRRLLLVRQRRSVMENVCPKCGAPRHPEATDCPRCGIIFDKYEAAAGGGPPMEPPPLPGGPPMHPPPVAGGPPGPPPFETRTSPLAIWSLVLGILGFLCCGFFTAIPGVVCGHLARSRIRQSGGLISGDGLALAGLIVGYASMVIYAMMIIFGVIGMVVEMITQGGF
jgi:ribosomal protein L40E